MCAIGELVKYTVSELPFNAGIDAHNTLIDRIPTDNMMAGKSPQRPERA